MLCNFSLLDEKHCRQGCFGLWIKYRAALKHRPIKREASIWCVFIITVRRLWPDGRDATLDKLQSHVCSEDISLWNLTLNLPKIFFKYLHMPTKSCCWLCCCAFRIRFSQVKDIHLQWSTWMSAINSPQGFCGPGIESRVHAFHTTHEAQKKWGICSAGDCWLSESRVFEQFPAKLLPFVIS